MSKKILFIALFFPNRSPSQRFRYEQFIPFFEQSGVSCTLKWIINQEDELGFYKGNSIQKAIVFMKSTFRLFKIVQECKNYPIVFIQRETYFLGTSFFERQIAKHSKIIYDFDDSIWLQNISESNKKFSFLKNPDKTKDLISLATTVVAGNKYLANYAIQYNQNVVIIPTVLDTSIYFPREKPISNSIVIGWSGSHTTIPHFNSILPVLKILKNKYPNRISFKVMGDATYSYSELDIQGIAWSVDSEIETINSFDIGIMPLPNDEWTQGKCGFKGLQYMSLAIPTIMSAVGVNTEIIEDGVNGYLAHSEAEWIEKLSLLIENSALRTRLGQAGRVTIENKYSVNAWKDVYLQLFKK